MLDFTGSLRLLHAAVKKGLEEIIGGFVMLLLVASLIAVYGYALGGSIW